MIVYFKHFIYLIPLRRHRSEHMSHKATFVSWPFIDCVYIYRLQVHMRTSSLVINYSHKLHPVGSNLQGRRPGLWQAESAPAAHGCTSPATTGCFSFNLSETAHSINHSAFIK